jgi:phage terminase large subunit
MDFKPTTALKKIQRLKKRLRICQGGACVGKTITILMCLIDLAGSHPNLTISVVSETGPHLKKGAIRDFVSIMQAQNYWGYSAWNKTDSIYTFPTGTIIECFSADSPDKVRGPGRDILFIHDCNNVPYETYRQLAPRTRRIVCLDLNPVAEFYVHTELMDREVADFIKLTYVDNEALPRAQVREIELLRKNENLWRIYGLGEVGINEGQIYTSWHLNLIDAPAEAELVRHALDYGYTNDPSVLLDVYRWNGAYILDEVLYKVGQNNRMIADTLRVHEGLEPVSQRATYEGRTRVLSVADSSEPKSNDEMKLSCGILITGAVKGEGSVNYGTPLLQQQTIYATARSTTIIKEVRNYLWKKDKATDEPLNVPVNAFNRALDAARYAITDVLGNPKKSSDVWVV